MRGVLAAIGMGAPRSPLSALFLAHRVSLLDCPLRPSIPGADGRVGPSRGQAPGRRAPRGRLGPRHRERIILGACMQARHFVEAIRRGDLPAPSRNGHPGWPRSRRAPGSPRPRSGAGLVELGRALTNTGTAEARLCRGEPRARSLCAVSGGGPDPPANAGRPRRRRDGHQAAPVPGALVLLPRRSRRVRPTGGGDLHGGRGSRRHLHDRQHSNDHECAQVAGGRKARAREARSGRGARPVVANRVSRAALASDGLRAGHRPIFISATAPRPTSASCATCRS